MAIMDRTRMKVGRLCLIFLLLSFSASEEIDDMAQREVTFDFNPFGQMDFTQPDDGLQKEVTHSIELHGDFTQRELPLDRDILRVAAERASSYSRPVVTEDHFPEVPALFGPRSMRPELPFPPGQPTPENLHAICLYSNSRPRFPGHSLPSTGFGYLHRQAAAINRLESWYSVCCHGNDTQDPDVMLCCAQQAWKKALSGFCEEEFSIKTSHYHCCKKITDADKWQCFKSQAINPSYQSSHPSSSGPLVDIVPKEPSFQMNPKTCKKSGPKLPHPRQFVGSTIKKSNIDFPPGRPNADNIQQICTGRMQRPFYLVKCLPPRSYGWLARQSKAINRLERGMKECCKEKTDRLTCAEQKWQEMVKRFCQRESEVKDRMFDCCKREQGEERHTCFAVHATNPGYVPQNALPVTHTPNPTPAMLCETHRIIKKQNLTPFPVDNIAKKCCHLAKSKRGACVQRKIDALQDDMCTGKLHIIIQLSTTCCGGPIIPREKCFTNMLLSGIHSATKSKGFKRRKCPLF